MEKPEVIYEDTDIIAVSKPAGIPVHEAKHSTDYTLVDWLLERFPEIKDVGDLPAEAFREGGSAYGIPYRPGIVHRLDKQTSGVMIVARNQESFHRLKELFQSRQIEKTYLALVCGIIKEKSGVIEKPVGRIVATPMKMGVLQSGAAGARGRLRLVKTATTEYKVLQTFSKTALLEVHPLTGRMHQIRVHLSSIGHPVAGDTVYGGKNVCHEDLGRLFLHASSLVLSFEEGRRFAFSADLPAELASLLEQERLSNQEKSGTNEKL